MRILVWNLQKFSPEVINPPVRAAGAEQTLMEGVGVQTRISYITSTVEQADPAIFVVIELQSSCGARGSLVSGNGQSAAIDLLTLLQDTHDQRWLLVPPVRLVNRVTYEDARQQALDQVNPYTEGIAVYFRSDRVDFVGPYVWPQTPGGGDPADKVPVPAGGPTQPYPAPWAAAVGNRTAAGQWEFKRQNTQLDFPPGDKHRRPWRTHFAELGPQGQPTGRILQLTTVHLPPQEGDAREGLCSLLDHLGGEPLPAQTIRLLAGDFNVNDGSNPGLNRYDWDDEMPFRNLLAPKPDRHGIYKRCAAATPESYSEPKALDGAYVSPRGRQGLAAFIDRVSDPQGPPGPPGAPRQPGFWCAMTNALAQIRGLPDATAVFQRYDNFGHIGPRPGTSDHMPLLIHIE